MKLNNISFESVMLEIDEGLIEKTGNRSGLGREDLSKELTFINLGAL